MPAACEWALPCGLSGVDIGNVAAIRVVPDKDKQITPVEVIMKVSTKYGFDLRRDSVTSLETAGVLGETYLDIDSSQAIGPVVRMAIRFPRRSIPTSTKLSAPAKARCRTWTRC